MVIVVPSTVTVPLSLVTTVVPLKVIVVVELSESLSSDSVVVVPVAESEALLVNTEAVSDAVASVVLELVLELVFSSALFVSDAEVCFQQFQKNLLLELRKYLNDQMFHCLLM